MRYAFFVAALFFAPWAAAGGVAVSDAWARATAPGQDNGAIYMRISSQKEASIVTVSSPAAYSAAIHSMTHENGVMKMRELEALTLPAGREVVLGPGSNHLMLNDLRQPLKAGDRVVVTLTVKFADSSTELVLVQAEVRPLTANHGAPEHHHDH